MGDSANTLYGFSQGAMAAGGLAGGICSGIFAKRLSQQNAGVIAAACCVCVFPMGAALLFSAPTLFVYGVMVVSCFVFMLFSTIFTVRMMSFVQAETPPHLIGKVISVIMTVSMCSQPLGNALYGVLFDVCAGFECAVIFFSGAVSMVIALGTKNIFGRLQVQ